MPSLVLTPSGQNFCNQFTAPINEPASFKSSAIIPATKNLYRFSYSTLRHPFDNPNTQGNLLLILSDAFEGLNYWNGFMTGPAYQGVAMDQHIYDIFSTSGLKQTGGQHISVCFPFPSSVILLT